MNFADVPLILHIKFAPSCNSSRGDFNLIKQTKSCKLFLMQNKKSLWILWFVFLFGALVGAALVSLGVGSAGIGVKKIIRCIFFEESCIERTILLDIRLPRIILAIAVGGALSVSGAVLQGIFRNPLVEPYTLGVSGGAALLASICIVYKLSFLLPVAGFTGAILAIFLVSMSSRKKESMLLSGVMISFIASSLVMFIMAVAGSQELHSIIFWIMGGLGESNMGFIICTSVLVIAATIVVFFYSNVLNAMRIGDSEAAHLGVNVHVSKMVLFVISSALAGCSISASGIIGFVGLIVPHLVRSVVGGDYRVLTISSFLVGGIFLLLCDTLARTIIAPLELPVGVITGIIGGVVILFMLRKEKYRC